VGVHRAGKTGISTPWKFGPRTLKSFVNAHLQWNLKKKNKMSMFLTLEKFLRTTNNGRISIGSWTIIRWTMQWCLTFNFYVQSHFWMSILLRPSCSVRTLSFFFFCKSAAEFVAHTWQKFAFEYKYFVKLQLGGFSRILHYFENKWNIFVSVLETTENCFFVWEEKCNV